MNNKALQSMVAKREKDVQRLKKEKESAQSEYGSSKELAEQLQIELKADRVFIEELKASNEKLEASNQELLILNADLQHELQMYDYAMSHGKTAAKQHNKGAEK